jgi:hypothetical protein
MTGFIIKTRDMKTMKVFYYTGRAGAAGTDSFWLSETRAAAFVYATAGEAIRKSRVFQHQHPRNLGTGGAAVWMVEHANPADAHAAGAAAMSQEMCG